MNGLSKAIDKYGLTGLARHLGVKKGVVYQWRERQSVPAEYCPEIEKLMSGEVRCEDLNDKVNWTFLRSIQKTPASDEELRRRSTDRVPKGVPT
jgi:DNA-binding transcriptional regulator YdaS (Cro superfamily)